MVEDSRIFDDSRLKVKPVSKVILDHMRIPVALSILLLLFSACTVSLDDSEPVATSSPAPAPNTSAPQTLVPDPDEEGPPCLQGDQPFSTSGVISAFGGSTGDAAQVSGIRTGFHSGCERIVVDLLTAGGAPAGSVGLVGVDYDEMVGVVRINLPPAIQRTAIADLRLDGELADRAFVVQTEEGNLALDIHVVAGAAVALRDFEIASPSRIVVDLRPDPESPAAVGAAFSPGVVVTHPQVGSGGVPLVVSGYARSDSPDIETRLHDSRETDPVAVARAAVAPSAQAWSEFELTFFDPPRGSVELHVGDDQDGIWLSIDNGPLQVLGGEDA